jgi:hypothetical protein
VLAWTVKLASRGLLAVSISFVDHKC